MMNLFENLQLMKESKQYDIGFGHLGNGITVWNRSEMQYGDYKKIAYISDDGVIKYYDSNLPEDVKDKIEKFANHTKQQNDEKVKKDIESKKKNDEFLRNRFKTESLTNDKLWDKFNELFKGFIPLEDLTNYFSLDQFGEFVQWLRHEADMDYEYNKIYRNWDEVFKDLYDATGSENTDSISMENIFNFFSTTDLEDFWEWIEKEYDIDDRLEESKHLKEYKSNINNKTELWDEMIRYTEEPLVSFNDLFNCYSTDDLQDLYDYLSSEYEDDEFPVYRGKINNKDEMWDAMNELILPNEQQVSFNNLFNCYSLDKLKDLYDYLSSEYSDIDDLDESMKFEESIEDMNSLTYLVDKYEISYEDIVKNLDKWLSDNEIVHFVQDYMNDHGIKYDDDLEESVKLEKLSIGNKLQAVFDKFDSNIKLVGFMLQFIDEDTIEKMYNEIASVEEATSGIGGTYTTKAIDMIPTGVKKGKRMSL